MRFDSFNPHRDPIARELREANAQLQGINDHLWELGQPPEVRADLQARRAEHARGLVWAGRAVLGLVVVGWLLTKVFGAAGAYVFAGALSLAWKAFQVMFGLGVVLAVWEALRRGVRWLAGRSGGEP